MGHDVTKIVMGAGRSSFSTVESHVGSIAAGLVVRLKSDDTISVAKADGNALGVSLGTDMSDSGYTAIAVRGSKVPVVLASGFTTPVKGGQVSIEDTTGKAKAPGSGVTAVNAIYLSGVLTGTTEDGSTVSCALIHFPGGL